MLLHWAKQIEQVLTESERIRKESDDIGPSAELAHWKRRMIAFSRYHAIQQCFFFSNNIHSW